MITIALTATKRGERSIICLELRPDDQDRHAIWTFGTNLLSGFENEGSKRVGKVTKDGARVEIESSLPWAEILAEMKTIAARITPTEITWDYQGDALAALYARTSA